MLLVTKTMQILIEEESKAPLKIAIKQNRNITRKESTVCFIEISFSFPVY